jgi:hypothetical protein
MNDMTLFIVGFFVAGVAIAATVISAIGSDHPEDRT